jgi:hypothetical protein
VKQARVLALASLAEAGTGVVLLVAPGTAAALLLGTGLPGVATLIARCFGIAALSLGVACWPGRSGAANGSQPVRGMAIYNLLIAALLAYAGAVEHLAGPLLWPAVALHAVVGPLLARGWSTQQGAATRT